MIDDGLSIVMSPVQLAAVLSDKSVTEGETLSNRLYGGLDLLAGILELAGSRALCMTPAGRVFTAACVIVGAHSMDTIQASINQIRTGINTRTATYRLAVETAKNFGADDETAWNVGMAVDVGVPIGFSLALGAARIASIRIGRIKLIEHESATGFKPGGHTIAKHVGLKKEQLAERLTRTEKMSKRPNYASSFDSVNMAESAISKALHNNQEWIKVWASSNPNHRLEMIYDTGITIGKVLVRGKSETISVSKVKVVLHFEQFHGKPYYILTAFPEV